MLLGVAEMFSLDLIFLMLAGGALGGALASALGLTVGWQIVVAAATSLLLLFALRPFLLRRLRERSVLVETNSAALVGRPATVVAPTDGSGGRVKIAGEVWSARAAADGVSFPAGAEVRVTRIDGATAVVEAAANPAAPGSDAPGTPAGL